MTASGTYDWSLDLGDVVLEAADRIGIRPNALLREHYISARRSLNLTLQSWANKVPLLWAIDLQSVPLLSGVATYNVPQETVTMLDTYIETGTGATLNDRFITPLSRNDYAAIPNKTNQSPPTTYWFDRLSPIPTVTLWPVPEADSTYTLKYYRMRRIQDANPVSGQTADIPYLFLDALCAELSQRLASKYAPDRLAEKMAEAKEAWALASGENRERADFHLVPDIGAYWR